MHSGDRVAELGRAGYSTSLISRVARLCCLALTLALVHIHSRMPSELTAEIAAEPEFYTLDEVAALLRCSPTAVRDRVKRGSIPADCVVRVVKPMLFRAAKLRAWLDAGECA